MLLISFSCNLSRNSMLVRFSIQTINAETIKSSFFLKVQRTGVYAKTLPSWCLRSIIKDMTQMAAALCTDNFYSGSVTIVLDKLYIFCLLEARPACSLVELYVSIQ